MNNKIYLAMRVYNISDKYNVNKILVHSIIEEYINFSKKSLLNGERIDFLGLVYIEPDVVSKNYKSTLGFTCKLIADDLGLPSHTVYVIVKEYLLSLKDGILDGKTAEIRGIVTMHPLIKNGKVTNIHSAISTSIKKYIEENNCSINSVRVHTYKSLKEELLNEAE